METYKKILEKLNSWILVSSIWLDEEELEQIYDLHLLTNKKFVYACNVSEEMMWTPEEELKKIIWIEDNEIKAVAVSAKLEEDMIEMSIEERKEFLEEMWLSWASLDNLIKTSYDALGLEYYFTAWEKEVRAWTIKMSNSSSGSLSNSYRFWKMIYKSRCCKLEWLSWIRRME